ncbi:uncharacterized protein LOC131242935 isoform X2 [Magnolia sinica]|uniref:uncharacterized protein LOC131242935 isoform X2 n=1 Tax=Magnolia sinica TaxID=86752 RepID=UPI0026589689|nr:uncharacterized protein LOC131242935 isoform X2 [Magnolia sinica]
MQLDRGWKNGKFEIFGDDFTESAIGEREINSMSPSDILPGANYIEHRVSKMDTLAGVAIKYGVEVSDIKRMNGLVTDLQMFAHKTLQIPLPGRHPPSHNLSDGSPSPGESSNGQSQSHQHHLDVLNTLQSLKSTFPQRSISPAMSSLQGYYGLKPEGTEMEVYENGGTHYLEDEQLTSPASDLPPRHHRRTRSLANGFLTENGELVEALLPDETGQSQSKRPNQKSVWRSQKADADPGTPELLLKDDCSMGFSGITGKGLAQRPKSVSRATEADSDRFNPIPMGDSFLSDIFTGFRKSSSTSNLQDSETNSSSIWPTSKWNLKPDSQALSTAATTRSMFDGLPKPTAVRRNKAALD